MGFQAPRQRKDDNSESTPSSGINFSLEDECSLINLGKKYTIVGEITRPTPVQSSFQTAKTSIDLSPPSQSGITERAVQNMLDAQQGSGASPPSAMISTSKPNGKKDGRHNKKASGSKTKATDLSPQIVTGPTTAKEDHSLGRKRVVTKAFSFIEPLPDPRPVSGSTSTMNPSPESGSGSTMDSQPSLSVPILSPRSTRLLAESASNSSSESDPTFLPSSQSSFPKHSPGYREESYYPHLFKQLRAVLDNRFSLFDSHKSKFLKGTAPDMIITDTPNEPPWKEGDPLPELRDIPPPKTENETEEPVRKVLAIRSQKTDATEAQDKWIPLDPQPNLLVAIEFQKQDNIDDQHISQAIRYNEHLLSLHPYRDFAVALVFSRMRMSLVETRRGSRLFSSSVSPPAKINEVSMIRGLSTFFNDLPKSCGFRTHPRVPDTAIRIGKGATSIAFKTPPATPPTPATVLKVFHPGHEGDAEFELAIYDKLKSCGFCPLDHIPSYERISDDVTSLSPVGYPPRRNHITAKNIAGLIDVFLCLHSHKLVHGDVAPRNIVADRDAPGIPSNLRLIDFGSCSQIGAKTYYRGTIPYIPQRLRGNHIDPMADSVQRDTVKLYPEDDLEALVISLFAISNKETIIHPDTGKEFTYIDWSVLYNKWSNPDDGEYKDGAEIHLSRLNFWPSLLKLAKLRQYENMKEFAKCRNPF